MGDVPDIPVPVEPVEVFETEAFVRDLISKGPDVDQQSKHTCLSYVTQAQEPQTKPEHVFKASTLPISRS